MQTIKQSAADTSPIQDIYPLSPTQQGMLFHGLLTPGSGVYVVQIGFTIKGNLKLDAFEQAWHELQDRHDVLRTAFAWEKLEQPMQVVGRQTDLPIDIIDWREEEATTPAYDEWLQHDRAHGFDLRRAPLMRITLFRLADDTARVVWSYHHLLMDGWSLPILLREWFICYQSTAQGIRPVLPSPVPYREYIAWLQTNDKKQAIDFWREQLQGFSSPNTFPNNIKKLSGNSPSAAATLNTDNGSQTCSLDEHTTSNLQGFARDNRLTMSTLIQGAWALLVSRYSTQNDVVFGVARSGRPPLLQGIEQRVGLFLNLLPTRTTVDENKPLISWLTDLQQSQLQQQPFEYTALREVHEISDVPAATPLFESIVVFENYPTPPDTERGNGKLDISDIDISEQTNYPLSLYAVADQKLKLKLLHDNARFDKESIEHMLEQLQTTLHKIATHDAVTISDLLTLPQRDLERDHLLNNHNFVDATVFNIADSIRQSAQKDATRTAVICQQSSLSYAELDSRANQLANHLLQQGIEAGQTIGICLQRSLELPIALLAVMRCGCSWLPLDNTYPVARLQHIISDAGVNSIIIQPATRNNLPDGTYRLIDIEHHRQAIASQSVADTGISAAADDTAYLIYTSGSTGKPKGVSVSHNNLTNLLSAMQQRIGFDSERRLLAVTTFAFDIAMLELLLPLVNGACLVIADETQCRDATQLVRLLEHHHIDTLQATPATWRLLLAVNWPGKNTICALCGGEALDISTAQKLLERTGALWNVYGPTETTIWSTALKLTPALLHGNDVPIGNALANTVLHVLDQQQRPLPVGIPGELCIGGLGVSNGYHGLESMTSERFIDNPLHGSLHGYSGLPETPKLYRTGDLVRLRNDGLLDFLGRIDHQIKIRGYRIELGEIETVISKHPAVRQAVVETETKLAATRLIAIVTLEGNDKDKDIAEVIGGYIAQQLPVYMLPNTIQVVDNIPLTANNKIDRQAVRRLCLPASGSGTQPRTPLQRELANIWQQVTDTKNIGPDDNFFEIGGHSLLVIRAQGMLKDQLGIELELVDLFRYPTPAALAAHIELLQKTTNTSLSDKMEHKRHTQQAGLARRKALKARRHTVSTTG